MRQRRKTILHYILLLCLLWPAGAMANDALFLLDTPHQTKQRPQAVAPAPQPRKDIQPVQKAVPVQAAVVVAPVPVPEPVIPAPVLPPLTTPVPVVPVLSQPVPLLVQPPVPLGAKLPAAIPVAVPPAPRCAPFLCSGVFVLLGLIGAAGLLFLVFRGTSGGFRNQKTLAEVTGLPVISGDIGDIRAMLDVGHIVIAVTATQAGEGVSTRSLQLAQDAARSGARTVLIDCNLHTPSLYKAASDPAAPTLIDMLTHQARLEEILQKDAATGLHMIPTRAVPNTALDLLQSVGFERLLQALRSVYDLVVLDVPAVSVAPDARSLCRFADLTLYCVQARRTSRASVLAGLQALNATTKGRLTLTLTHLK